MPGQNYSIPRPKAGGLFGKVRRGEAFDDAIDVERVLRRIVSERATQEEDMMSKRGQGDRKKAQPGVAKSRRRATGDLPARRAGAVTGKTKGTGGGAGKVNVQDLSFTHYE
jgi:hypothetical protein